MSKAAVTRLFTGGALAVLAGVGVAVTAVWIAIANDVFVMNGPDIVALRGSGSTWVLLGFGAIGGLTILAGMISGVVAWIGALLNTWQLESKAWFIALLLLGIFSLGFVAMIGYIVAGPDGTADAAVRSGQMPAGATPA